MALTESRPGSGLRSLRGGERQGLKLRSSAHRVSEIGTLRGNFWKRPQIVLFQGVTVEYFKFYPYMG